MITWGRLFISVFCISSCYALAEKRFFHTNGPDPRGIESRVRLPHPPAEDRYFTISSEDASILSEFYAKSHESRIHARGSALEEENGEVIGANFVIETVDNSFEVGASYNSPGTRFSGGFKNEIFTVNGSISSNGRQRKVGASIKISKLLLNPIAERHGIESLIGVTPEGTTIEFTKRAGRWTWTAGTEQSFRAGEEGRDYTIQSSVGFTY